MSQVQEMKRAAAAHAARRLHDDMVVGLGSGSTAALFLESLGARLHGGRLRNVVGVATSLETASAAAILKIPVTTLRRGMSIDLTVDGADEVDPRLDLVKGLGGALMREKMVAQASVRLLIVVDEKKIVDRLGTRSPVPVEVVPFGWSAQSAFIESLGARAALRTREGTSEPFVTDNGNYVLDCFFEEGIDDPSRLDALLHERAGIVETGLFLGMADEIVIGGEKGVRSLTREDRP